MERSCAPEAHRESSARAPSGLRRLSLAMLATEKLAEGFSGMQQGAGVPGQVLSAFKAAAPYLGFGPRVVHAVDWLFKFTQAQDWGEGARPIVWPSASMQREALGLGLTQVKALNRHLIEAGLIAMKDSPNGKRYGKRDGKGRIVEAYGFDLSPLAARQAEFVAVAAQGKAERERMRLLRRRATIARNGLGQILETVAELGLLDAAWVRLDEEGRALARSLSKLERLDEMEIGVGIHVDVAVAHPGLDCRDGRIAHHRVDQSGTAPRDHHVDQPTGLNQVGDTGAVGAGKQLHDVVGKILPAQRAAQHAHQFGIGVGC